MDPFNIAILAATWLMMLAVGLSTTAGDLAAQHGRPALLASTLAAQWLILPLFALAIARALGLSPALTAALLLLAACPVGDIVNYYALVGGGTVPLTVALNALSCLAAPLGMGLVFAILHAVHPAEPPLSPPTWSLVLRVLLLALAPIALGLIVRARWPDAAVRWLRPLGRLAGAGILGVLAWGLARQRDHLVSIWATALPAVSLFLLAALAVGVLWARWWRLPAADSLSVLVTFPVRNVGLAAALATTLLGRPEFLSLFALYFLLEVPLFLLGARLWRAAAGTAGCERPNAST
jgi:BASS family bile acid:Na+ symporter